MSPVSARFAFWKRSAKSDCVRVFIKLQAAKCSARHKRFRRMKKRRSGRAVRTAWQKFFRIGRPSIIARVTVSRRATESCSITKVRVAAKLLSPERFRAQSPRLSRVSVGNRKCDSKIWFASWSMRTWNYSRERRRENISASCRKYLTNHADSVIRLRHLTGGIQLRDNGD